MIRDKIDKLQLSFIGYFYQNSEACDIERPFIRRRISVTLFLDVQFLEVSQNGVNGEPVLHNLFLHNRKMKNHKQYLRSSNFTADFCMRIVKT